MPLRPIAHTGLAVLSPLLAAGCNTMSGVDQDITGTAHFMQAYMPPELQEGGVDGVPALSGL